MLQVPPLTVSEPEAVVLADAWHTVVDASGDGDGFTVTVVVEIQPVEAAI
jgi:hypothetical protein